MRVLAFVDIRTISPGFIQRKTFVADAAEHSVNVFTFAKDTEIAEHLTFVDIYKELFHVLFKSLLKIVMGN